MSALQALRQSLDVQTTLAQGVVSPLRSPAPSAAARPTDRVTLSSAARTMAAGTPAEGEPTDLEGARRAPSVATLGARGSYGPSAAPAEPTRIDLFA